MPIEQLSPMEQINALFINHHDKRVPKTINNYDSILIGLSVISHESLEI
jgi:hypothetical protein